MPEKKEERRWVRMTRGARVEGAPVTRGQTHHLKAELASSLVTANKAVYCDPPPEPPLAVSEETEQPVPEEVAEDTEETKSPRREFGRRKSGR